MAPESELYRHPLGDATFRFRRGLLKATAPICLAITLLSGSAEARTEPTNGMHILSHTESSLYGEHFASSWAAPTMPSSKVFSQYPPVVQRWSNRIQIPIPNDPAIQRYIRHYLGKGRSTFVTSLERCAPYLPIVTEIFNSYGVPGELVAVGMVESRFEARASYRGAVGVWQLMAPTARSLGLRVDRWVDERQDPIKSTHAAARYLSSLHVQFGSWPLALAAYNAGDASVSNARRGSSRTFWEIAKRGSLPRITRHYVPKVLATAHLLRNLDALGFEYPSRFPVYNVEPVTVKSPLELKQVARWIDVPLKDLRELNPALRLGRLPPDGGADLHLPSGARGKFDTAYARYASK